MADKNLGWKVPPKNCWALEKKHDRRTFVSKEMGRFYQLRL
jgi:hypothetical protein